MKTPQSNRLSNEALRCDIPYLPPLDWDWMFSYLRGRALIGVEYVDNHRYLRTVAPDKNRWQSCGWIVAEPSPEKHLLRLEVSISLATDLPAIRARVERLFDLTANPQQIAAGLRALASGATKRMGLRVPGAFNGFEVAVRAILGQQISVKSATTIACRFAAAFGKTVETPFPALTRLTPTPERVAQAEIGEIASLGIIATRSKSILALAEAVAGGRIILEPKDNVNHVAETIVRLKELPG
ncbi:MAG: adenosine deaminase, partial [Acidobacteriota bacterium]|nr:adenosine deaminase [Acidobacteriota bacterium]